MTGPVRRYPYHWAVVILSTVVVVGAFPVFYQAGKTTAFLDGTAKLNLARRVFDNAHGEFSLAQLGGVWLPLMSVLELLTVWFDPLYYSGFSGSLISMVSFVFLTLLVFEIVRTLTDSALGGMAAAAVVVLNLNLVYFGTSTMAEMLLMALIAFCALSLIKLERAVEHDPRHLKWLTLSFLAFGTLCLTRYEGYFLMVFALPIALVALWFRNIRGWHLVSYMGTLATVPCLTILGWLIYQRSIFGDWFYFATSEYSAKEIDVVAGDRLYAVGNLERTFREYQAAVIWNYHEAVLGIGFAGVTLFVLRTARRKERSVTPAFLLGIPAFYLVSIYTGQIGVDSQASIPLNLRYGLTIGVLLAVAIGYLVATIASAQIRARTVARAAAVGVVCLVVAHSAPLWSDPVEGTVAYQESGAVLPAGSEEMAAWMSANYDGGSILFEAFGWEKAYIQLHSGLPLGQFVTEASPERWQAALADPFDHVDWVYVGVQTHDTVGLAMQEVATFDEEFEVYFENEAGTLYGRQDRVSKPQGD